MKRLMLLAVLTLACVHATPVPPAPPGPKPCSVTLQGDGSYLLDCSDPDEPDAGMDGGADAGMR